MQLIIIRHAIAVPHGTPGYADEERPLTPEGEAKFKEAARGLARAYDRPDALLTSPWLRARQTAAIAGAAPSRLRDLALTVPTLVWLPLGPLLFGASFVLLPLKNNPKELLLLRGGHVVAWAGSAVATIVVLVSP